MTTSSVLYGLICFSAGGLCLMITVYLAPHWQNRSVRLLIGLMVSISVWTVGYGMEFISPDPDLKYWWFTAKRLGNVWAPVCLLGFVLIVTGKTKKLNPVWKMGASVFPILFLGLFFTNPHHHLMIQSHWIDASGSAPVLLYTRGPIFYGFLVHNYGFVLLSVTALLQSLIRSKGVQQKQLLSVLLGVSIPLIANLMYQFGFDEKPHFDLTPAALTIAGIAFAFGVIRYQILELIPIAYETIIRSMEDPVIVLDKKDRILLMNRSAMELSGLEEWVPAFHRLNQVFPGVADALTGLRDQKESSAGQGVKISSKHFYLKRLPLKAQDDRTQGTLLVLRDETHRVSAETALEKKDQIHKSMLEASPNPIVFYDEQGCLSYMNEAFRQVFGWEPEELVGRRVDFVPEHEKERTSRALQNTIASPQGTKNFITQRYTKSGQLLDVTLNAVMYRTEDGSFENMVVNFTDITQLKKNERELQTNRAFIRNILDSMASSIIGVNEEGMVTHWNLAADRFTGIPAEKAIGTPLSQSFPAVSNLAAEALASLKEQAARIKERMPITVEKTSMIADVTVYPMVSASEKGVVIRVDDVTERVRMEEMMVQSEKMLSVGGLAAGMAHEINNPLAGMLQNTQVIWNRLSQDLPVNRQVAEACGIELEALTAYMEKRKVFTLMESIKSSGKRAASIVTNMLDFSRKSEGAKSGYMLDELMESTLALIKSDYNLKDRYDFKMIEIVREYQDGMPMVLCEKNEIQQVFLNILKNGAEAMAGAHVDDPRFIIRYFLQDGYAVLEIEDNGPGMDIQLRKRVFEPFYTTKEVGIGTGLGLSVSYFIVSENHNGVLDVRSEPGHGSCFIVKLPLMAA